MKAKKPIQNIQIAGVTLKKDDPGPFIVETARITKQQRKWDGTLIQIRDLSKGKSQIIRLV